MPTTKEEWLARLRGEMPQISPEEVRQSMGDGGNGLTLIDVRETEEYRQGAVPGARHLPRGFLEIRAPEVLPRRDARMATLRNRLMAPDRWSAPEPRMLNRCPAVSTPNTSPGTAPTAG